MRKIIAFLMLALLISPALSQVPELASGSILQVSGNQIVNNRNQVVHLRGVDKAGTEYMCLAGSVFDGPYDQASIDAMKAWNINIVRLPINEDCWLGINGAPSGLSSATYQSTIVNYVNMLSASGVSLHLRSTMGGSRYNALKCTHANAGC